MATAELAGKHIVLGMTGGIACYKIAGAGQKTRQDGALVASAAARHGEWTERVAPFGIINQDLSHEVRRDPEEAGPRTAIYNRLTD